MVEMTLKAREGDITKTADSIFFDVKGLVHPPRRIVAFVRYVPDAQGDRKKDSTTYRKVYHLRERYELLQERFPEYLVLDPVFDEELCEVPVRMVKRHLRPEEGLASLRSKGVLDQVETDALEFAELLKNETNVSWNKLGISGSLLVGLHKPSSDVDPVVYGSENCRKVYSTLKSLMHTKDSSVESYTRDGLKRLFDFRSKDTAVSFEDFLRTESRKTLQGMFKRRDFFIRCVKDWNDIEDAYGKVQYKSMGYAKIRATVTDDSEMIFTPCHYKIAGVVILKGVQVEPIEEIVSFRGRFCEQARNGEAIVAQGKVERVQTVEQVFYRLLLGNKTSDFMVPLDA